MHKEIANYLILLTAAILTSCSQHIKNDLDFAVGHDINTHEIHYGQADKITKTNTGTTRRYVNTKTECIYDLYLNNTNIVTNYRFISDEKICTLPLNWGGPW